MNNILVVDDDMSMRTMLRMVLEGTGYRVFEAKDGHEAVAFLRSQKFRIVLCDIRMPDMDGLAMLQYMKDNFQTNEIPTVIMMSAYGSIETAIECMKRGAYDYIAKPFKPDEVVLTIRKAEERLALTEENRILRSALRNKDKDYRIVYKSSAMERVMELIHKVAGMNSTVLITGETGTGKELVAREIHRQSSRSDKPFLALNCAAIPASLVESELFGHVKGAFTGAGTSRKGFFEEADTGTLFLDEIAELPIDLQPKLLRVLQENEFCRVGETKPTKIDVRVLAATAKDLRSLVNSGEFRDDLYYRLNVIEINLPALRDRREDILPLAEYLLEKFAAKEGVITPVISEEVSQYLITGEWKGNVRELGNYLERALLFSEGGVIDVFPDNVLGRDSCNIDLNDLSIKSATEKLERDYIARALVNTNGNKTKAAKVLEISLRSLMYKIRDYGIE